MSSARQDVQVWRKTSRLTIVGRIECPFVSVSFLNDNSDSGVQNQTFYNVDNATAEFASCSRSPANCIA